MGAFLAEAMGKLGLGMLADIFFNTLPVSGIVTNFFAGTTDGQKTA